MTIEASSSTCGGYGVNVDCGYCVNELPFTWITGD